MENKTIKELLEIMKEYNNRHYEGKIILFDDGSGKVNDFLDDYTLFDFNNLTELEKFLKQ